MLNKKVILIAIFLITLPSISDVSANEFAENSIKWDVNDSKLGLGQDSDPSTKSSLDQTFELDNDKNVLKSNDGTSLDLNNSLESSDDDSELDDKVIASSLADDDLESKDKNTVPKSADEHVLSMDENAWFYDKIVFYEGDNIANMLISIL